MKLLKSPGFWLAGLATIILLSFFQNCGAGFEVNGREDSDSVLPFISAEAIKSYRYSSSTVETPPALVFLLAGQSNMAGLGDTGALPASKKSLPPNVDFWLDGVKQTNFLGNLDINNDGRPDYGPEVGIAHQLASVSEFSSRRIVIIKVAVSGNPIKSWLNSYKDRAGEHRDSGRCFSTEYPGICKWGEHELPPLKETVAKVLQNYPKHEKSTVFWVQGESDAFEWGQTGPYYLDNFGRFKSQLSSIGFNKILISRLYKFQLSRHAVTQSTPLKYIPVQDGINYHREAQEQLASFYLGDLKTIDTDSFSLRDNFHYADPAYLELGVCMAQSLFLSGAYFRCDSSGAASTSTLSSAKIQDPLDSFLKDVYLSILGRAYDIEGYQYWAKEILTGSLTQSQVTESFNKLCKDRNYKDCICPSSTHQIVNGICQLKTVEAGSPLSCSSGFVKNQSQNACVNVRATLVDLDKNLQYVDLVGTSGLDYWESDVFTNINSRGMADWQALQEVVLAITVFDIYKKVLARDPTPLEMTKRKADLAAGKSRPAIEAEIFALGFVKSTVLNCSPAGAISELVSAYKNNGRCPDIAGYNYWQGQWPAASQAVRNQYLVDIGRAIAAESQAYRSGTFCPSGYEFYRDDQCKLK